MASEDVISVLIMTAVFTSQHRWRWRPHFLHHITKYVLLCVDVHIVRETSMSSHTPGMFSMSRMLYKEVLLITTANNSFIHCCCVINVSGYLT